MEEGTELAGRYRLQRLLGRGAMGQVWRAEDLRLARQVAVKLLLEVALPDAQQQQILARFHREGRATAKLAHPNIAAAYDAGEHAGRPFLVLELLHGRDLRTVLEQDYPHGMPLPLVVDYGAQAADALAAAHSADVVHRDIKPGNLMRLDDGTVKVCDFGIARLCQAATEPQLTQTGAVIGTPAYMAPEQFEGKSVDSAADIYALGATLFHLLTGRPVFSAPNLAALSVMHAGKPAPRVSSLRTDVPPALDAFIGTMLAKAPRRRPSAADAAARLRSSTMRVPVGLPSRAGRPPSPADVAEAVRTARAISNEWSRQRTLVTIARATAASDAATAKALLAEAEESVRSFRNLLHGDLVEIARATAELDPRHAAALLNEAEQLLHDDIRRTADGSQAEHHGTSLGNIARVWAVLDPDRAEALAQGIAHPEPLGAALGDIAFTLAASLPHQSQRLASRITGPARTPALQRIAVALAPVDLTAALRVAYLIDSAQDRPLVQIAGAAAGTDPAAAEQFAYMLNDPHTRDAALTAVAEAVAVTDCPDARRIAAMVGLKARDRVVRALLASGPLGVAQIVATIPPHHYSAGLQLEVCKTLASADPEAAARFAHAMPGKLLRASALRSVALSVAEDVPSRAHALLTAAAADARPDRPDSFSEGHVCTLASIGAAMAKVDVNDARVLLAEAAAEACNGYGLRDVAVALAAIDPDGAERLARRFRKKDGDHLSDVATALAAVDPAAGERIARRIKEPWVRDEALAGIAVAAATVDVAAAQRITNSIGSYLSRWEAVEGIVKLLGAIDPEAAVRFAHEAVVAANGTNDGPHQCRAARLVALVDPAGARRIAAAIEPVNWRDGALADIAEAIVGIADQDGGE
ncbi:serine/threonine-protein kinase [Streptomyces sp. NPDC059378]|uniref:serine/threonine-protein kinase n=1 Tax=Streptomyces sp. NPDC059378 TaxID=3346815 RepID=UPI0036BFF7BA